MATIQKRIRQGNVLQRLENQLVQGVKTEKKTLDTKVPLTDSDVKRINKEIAILKGRV
jgi:hypothetical protein